MTLLPINVRSVRSGSSTAMKNFEEESNIREGTPKEQNQETCEGACLSLEEWESVACVVVAFIRHHGTANKPFLANGEIAFLGSMLGSSTPDLISLCERSVVADVRRAAVARERFKKFGIRYVTRKCSEVIRYQDHHMITWASGTVSLTQIGGSYRRPENLSPFSQVPMLRHSTHQSMFYPHAPTENNGSPLEPNTVLLSVDVDPGLFAGLAICWYINAHGTNEFVDRGDENIGVLRSCIELRIKDIISEFAGALEEDDLLHKKEEIQLIHEAKDAAIFYARSNQITSIVASCSHLLRTSEHCYVVHRFERFPREFWNENIEHLQINTVQSIESKNIANTLIEVKSSDHSLVQRNLSRSHSSVDIHLLDYSASIYFPNNPISDEVFEMLANIPLRSKGEFDVLSDEKEETALYLLRSMGSQESNPRVLIQAIFHKLVRMRYAEAREEVKEKVG